MYVCVIFDYHCYCNDFGHLWKLPASMYWNQMQIARLELHGVKSISQRTFCLLVALTVAEYCQNIVCLELQSINAKTQSTDSSVEGLWARGNQDTTGGQGDLLPYAIFWSLWGLTRGSGCHISFSHLLWVVCSLSLFSCSRETVESTGSNLFLSWWCGLTIIIQVYCVIVTL